MDCEVSGGARYTPLPNLRINLTLNFPAAAELSHHDPTEELEWYGGNNY